MKRREFINIALFSSLALKLSAKADISIEAKHLATINAIQNIIFPHSKEYPSADELDVTKFLVQSITHPTFPKYRLELLLEGIKDFYELHPEYIKLTKEEQNKILENINQTSYGNSWLDLLVYLSIEAAFSDPIYGGNKNTIGWKSFNHTPGNPRPTRRYGLYDL